MPILYYANDLDVWVVIKCSHHTWKYLDVKWMGEEKVGENVTFATVDMVEEIFQFQEFKDAKKKMAELWVEYAKT